MDEASSNLSKHDFLGECQVNLGELVCDPNGLKLPLKRRDGSIFQGHLKARAEELLKSREFFKLRFAANGVSKGLFGSGFFFQIERANEDGSFGVVTRSKVMTGSPYVWSLPISGEKLCNGDLSRTLRIGFWKYKSNGSHKMQGMYTNCTISYSYSVMKEICNPQKDLLRQQRTTSSRVKSGSSTKKRR